MGSWPVLTFECRVASDTIVERGKDITNTDTKTSRVDSGKPSAMHLGGGGGGYRLNNMPRDCIASQIRLEVRVLQVPFRSRLWRLVGQREEEMIKLGPQAKVELIMSAGCAGVDSKLVGGKCECEWVAEWCEEAPECNNVDGQP